MTDRPAPPTSVVAALVQAFPGVEPANANVTDDVRPGGYTTDRIHVLRELEPVARRPTGHVEDVPHGAATDDLAVSGPMTIVRLRDGTLDLVPTGEVETEEGDHPVYAKVPPHQLLGVWRGGRWVRAEELPPTAVERPR